MNIELVLGDTRRWLEQVVIGLRLCPFAAAPYYKGLVRLIATPACTEAELLDALAVECQTLAQSDSQDCETSLLVHPNALNDFAEYNQFLDAADGLISSLGLTGVLQVASFHPDYCFAGSEADDRANFTNRSPYPMLHLLREQSIEAVIDGGADSEAIVARNIELLRAMSDEALRRHFAPSPATPGF